MKKIFSILILAVAGILSASASQVVKVVYNGTSRSITFKTNNVSATKVYYARSTNANPSFSSSVTATNSGNYSTFSISSGGTNNNTNKTINIQLDDAVTYFEISANNTYATSITLSGATNLASICLKGCTNLTTLTLGTMSALTDIDVSNTRAAVANAITAANCPNLENLNVANCSLSSFTYTGTNLYSLDITGNSISTLDLSACSKLDILRCESNSMTSLTLPAGITTLSAQNNSLTGVTGFGEPMQILDLANNNLRTLEMSSVVGLTDLDISSNHLTFRSFPSATYKPDRMLYAGNDGTYDLTGQMRAAFGSYSYPLMSMLPNYAGRTDASYTLHLADALLDGHNEKNVTAVPNSYDGSAYTPLTQATSDVDGNDYTIDATNDYYGFMKPQSRVRIAFTDATYPGLTLYSNDFTVPTSVTGTLLIVDTDGETLYTKTNAVFSDAMDGLPDDAVRDYTKYTYPAVPSTNGQTWTVTAEPSDDAPFGWAKTYGSATWYYLGLKNKWVTAGEQLYQLGGAQGNNGHKLKDTYSTSDNNYQWAFVGNQYSGFKIYNKGRGSGETLQDCAGFNTVSNQYGYFPVMKSGESLKWIVRTNSAGSGFSLENKAGGTDFSINSSGEPARAFLNDFQGLGALNYWISSVYDNQNDVGSLFTVLEASGAISATVKWVLMDGSNPVYTITEDVTTGDNITAYPTELTTMASQRFVTLPTLTAFTATSGENRKEITYTWTGPFDISTAGDEHHYKLKIRNAMYILSDLKDGGQLDCTSTDGTENKYRWMFFGDPFNGFIIRNYTNSSKALAAANGYYTNGSSFPTFEDEGTRWIITTCTQAGYTNPFSIAPAGTSGVYWNQYGGVGNNQGIKYWTANGTSDGGAAIQAIEMADPSSVYITWNVLDAEGNTVFTTTTEPTLNSTVSTYPTAMTDLESRFISYPALSSFTADRNKSVDVTYSWVGPFQFTTDMDNPHLYFFKSARYGYYAYAPNSSTGNAKQSSQTKNWVTPRGRWFFTGDPFDGIEIHPYAYPETGLVNSTLSTTPTKYIPRTNPDITTNHWDNALPSAAISFVLPSNTSSCLAEQLGTWGSASINSDKGLCFVVEDGSDISMLLAPGYYNVRCMGSGLTSKYWRLGDDHKLYNDGNTNNMNTVFRIEENINESNNLPASYYIAGFDGEDAWYLDNTKTTYSQQFTATQTEANYMPAQIIYNAKSGDTPYFAIKLGTFESYDGYSYANTNGNQTKVVTWNYTSGSANGSSWTFEPAELPARSVDNANYFTTAYLPFDYTLPAGVTAYTITVSGSEAVAHALTGGVPKGTAVLLVGNGVGNIKMTYDGYSPTAADLTNVADNALAGTYEDIATSTLTGTYNIYTFSGKNNEPGFYRYSGATLSAYKAYLPLSGSAVRTFIIVFDDEGAVTGIETLWGEGEEDGRFSWDDSSTWGNAMIYDLQGRRITQPQKGGIYIVNGRKVYFK